jgi:cell division septation protein DedD
VTEPHHEPSYYEIALTNRQVVVAFVILLACLLAAFFSGVWIGRGGIELRHDQMVRATPPAQTTPEGHTLEELKFFTDRQNKKGKENRPEEKSEKSAETVAAPAPVPTADDAQESRPKSASTLQQDLEPSSSAPQPSSRASRSAKSNSVVRQTPPAPVQAEPAEAPVRPEPVQSRTAADRTADTGGGSAGGAGTESAVVIQVFASADQAEAGRVRDRLTKGGQSAFLSPLTVDGRTMYRVRIGPFTSRQKAQTVAEKVRKNYKLDTWLTQ